MHRGTARQKQRYVMGPSKGRHTQAPPHRMKIEYFSHNGSPLEPKTGYDGMDAPRMVTIQAHSNPESWRTCLADSYLVVRRLSRIREHTCSYAAPSDIQGTRGNAANVCRLRHVRTLLFSYRGQLYQRTSSRRTPPTRVRQHRKRKEPTARNLRLIIIYQTDKVLSSLIRQMETRRAGGRREAGHRPPGAPHYLQTRWILLASKCMRRVSSACGSPSAATFTLLTFHCRRVGASARGTSSSTSRSKRESLTRATCKS